MFLWVNREMGFEFDKQGLVNRDFIPPFVSVQSTVPGMTPGCWQEWHSWGFGDGACFCFGVSSSWPWFLVSRQRVEEKVRLAHLTITARQIERGSGQAPGAFPCFSLLCLCFHSFFWPQWAPKPGAGDPGSDTPSHSACRFLSLLTLSQVPASHRGSNEGEWCFHYCLLS